MPLFDDTGYCESVLRPLYGVFEGEGTPDVVRAPAAFHETLVGIFTEIGWAGVMLADVPTRRPEYTAPDEKKMILGYSGGKDSLAATLLAQAAGYDVTLFHVTGVNPVNPDELACTNRAAKALDLPLVIRPVRAAARRRFPDNPVKNLLIIGMMVDYGAANGAAAFAQGHHRTEGVDEANILYNWSCSREVVEAGARWYAQVYPPFQWKWFLEGQTHALKTVVERGAGLLQYTTSCVHPYRFRATVRKANAARYNMEILPGRCGSCWKCAEEYLILVCMAAAPARPDFIRHSLKIFRAGMPRNFGPEAAAGITAAGPRAVLDATVNPVWVDNSPLLEYME